MNEAVDQLQYTQCVLTKNYAYYSSNTSDVFTLFKLYEGRSYIPCLTWHTVWTSLKMCTSITCHILPTDYTTAAAVVTTETPGVQYIGHHISLISSFESFSDFYVLFYQLLCYLKLLFSPYFVCSSSLYLPWEVVWCFLVVWLPAGVNLPRFHQNLQWFIWENLLQ